MQHTSKNWRAVRRGTGDTGRVIRACSPTLRTPAHQRLKTVATTARTDRAHIQNNIIRPPLPHQPTDIVIPLILIFVVSNLIIL